MRYILVLGEPRTVDLVGQATYGIHKTTGAELHVFGCPVGSVATMTPEQREKIACVVVDESAAGLSTELSDVPVIEVRTGIDLDAELGAALSN